MTKSRNAFKKAVTTILVLLLSIALCSCNNTVASAKKAAKKVTLNKKSVTLKVGEKTTLKVKSVSPKSASKKVMWTSSKKKIASVNKRGIVKAKKKGKAVIKAKTKGGKTVAKCNVKVKSKNSSNILVAYFSCTGNTKKVAKKIASSSGADIYRIKPEEEYTSSDLNYNNDNSRANREMNDPTSRPAISGSVDNMDEYDIVFLGYPIWWGTAPRIIDTFVESYDFSGKTIVPFCTSGSSSIGTSVKELKQLCSKATWLSGKRFESTVSESKIASWLDTLDLK